MNLRKEGDSGPRRIRIPGRFVFQKSLWPTQANSVLIHKREAKKKTKKTLSSKGANFQSVLKRTKANLSWRRGFPQTLPPYTQHLTKRLRKCWEVGMKGRWGRKGAAGMGGTCHQADSP